MGSFAAKEGDHVVAVDMHRIKAPFVPPRDGSPPEPVGTELLPHPFDGPLSGGLSPNVRIEGHRAATVGSRAVNTPPHVPMAGSFVFPPTNEAEVVSGSVTVRINGRPAARSGDTALTCNDPAPLPVGRVEAQGTVRFG